MRADRTGSSAAGERAAAAEKKERGARKRRRTKVDKQGDEAAGGEDAGAPAASAAADSAKEAASCTVYVEGIPYESSEDDLRGFFKACGAIAGLRMPRCVGPSLRFAGSGRGSRRRR